MISGGGLMGLIHSKKGDTLGEGFGINGGD